jgi:preprotein translocase subunit SecE
MSAKTEVPEYRLDVLKWALVALLVVGGIFGNSYYSDISLAYRVPALLAGALAAIFIAVNTAKGAALWDVLKESIVEVRKVVWPSIQETHQTTLIVIIVVLLMAVILWGLDSLLGWTASLILG